MFKVGDRVKVKYHYYERHRLGCIVLKIGTYGDRIKIRDLDCLNCGDVNVEKWIKDTDLEDFTAGHRDRVLKELGI